MAKRQNRGKLTGRAAENTPAPVMLDAAAAEVGEMPDALALIQSLTAESGDGIEWNVRVYQVMGAMGRGNANRQQFLFEVPITELPTLETGLAQEYPAGGTFRVMIRANNQLKKIVLLDIAPRPGYRPPTMSYLSPAAPAAPAAEANPAPSRLELLLENMAREQQATREALMAMMNRPAPPQPTIKDQLEMFQTFSSMLPKATQENTMEMFQKGMDFAMKIIEAKGPNDGGGSNWTDVMRDLLQSPVVKEMVTAALQAAPAAAAPQYQQLPQPVGPGQPAPAPAMQRPARLVDANNPEAVNVIQALLTQAAAGTDPKLIVTSSQYMIPEPLLDELSEQEDMLAYIIQQFPAVAPHRRWFEGLIAEIFDVEQSGPASAGTFAHAPEGSTNTVKPPA